MDEKTNIVCLGNEMPKASAAPSSSARDEGYYSDIKELKEYGDTSFFRGYDEAITILESLGEAGAAKKLRESRKLIEVELNHV